MHERNAARADDADRHGSQAGFSLIEALISIMLTSIVILGLAGSLLAAVKASGIADRVQRADSALGSFTESLKTMPYPIVSDPSTCSSPSLDDFKDGWAGYVTAGDGWQPSAELHVDSIEITAVEHWEVDSSTGTGSYVSACPSGSDPYSHRLTVEVDIDGKARTAQVVVVPL